MTLILSGTDGLSDIDGSAATPAIRGTDANTGIFFGTDIIGFSEGGAECARFNADAQFVAAAGTAALPVVTTTGDVNTGVFFPAADTVAVSTGGSERARITSTGDVIVGGTTSSAKLTVFSDISLRSGAAELAKINGQTATSVSTSATNILAASFGYGALAIVNGYSGAAAFCDLVFFGNVTAAAVSSQTVSGSPAARTYTAVSGQLKLAMASGTYTVTAVQQYINAY